jgi:hypothetical protein
VDLELDAVRERILTSRPGRQFILHCARSVREFLVDEGTDPRYGARHLKRAIERHLVFPLSNLIATGQIELGDIVEVEFDAESGKLAFSREPAAAVVGDPAMAGAGVGEEEPRPSSLTTSAEASSARAAARDSQNVC